MPPYLKMSTGTLLIFMIALHMVMAQKQKIILDTDIGSDIDDAFAVALILASPEFEVLTKTSLPMQKLGCR